MCEENNSINKFPSLPSSKATYQGVEGGMEQLLFVKEWRPQGPMPYQQGLQYLPSYNTSHNVPFQSYYPPNSSPWSMPSP